MKHIKPPEFNDSTIYTTAYTEFLGCAFVPDETKCGDAYSPDCLNMIPDIAGFPEKRPGWRTLKQFDAYIFGIHVYQAGETKRFLIHSGTDLYLYDLDGTVTLLFSGMREAKSVSVPYNNCLYLLDGGNYLCFDGEKVFHVGDDESGSLDGCTAFIPTTSVLCRPEGGGTTYQKYNMLTRWRKNTFVTDGKALTYTVDTGRIDPGSAIHCVDLETGDSLDEHVHYIDCSTGTLHFDTPPEAPTIEGTQRMEVTFACTPETEYASIVPGCTIATLYGYDAANRLFVSGHPDKRNTLYYSENNDPSYFSDLNYIEIGVRNFRIVGFLKTAAGELAVLKEHNDQEATIWHVSAEMNQETGTYFPIREGVSGMGAVSPFCQCQLKNDSLFLGLYGVHALATSYSNAKYMSFINLRSAPVNERLLHSAGLASAFACVWDNKYLLFLGGNVYLMDTSRNWFFWDNVPAVCCASSGDLLLFGTSDGRFCRFNTDRKTAEGQYRMDAYSDDGAPILARWTTKISPDGDIFQLKNLQQNGFGVYIKPYPRTSVDVYIKSTDQYQHLVKSFDKKSFDFNDVDFSDFSFDTRPSYSCAVRARLRGYAGLQIVLENGKVDQAFGLSQIVYRYMFVKFSRR